MISPPNPVRVVFHGGEPLLAGSKWFEHVLSELFLRFGNRLRTSVQSNLWLLDDHFCELFRRYGVQIGTSLDGPQEINDAQRGKGYFDKTMKGIFLSRRHGMEPGVVCTFTPSSASRMEEVLSFFSELGLSLNVHTVFDPRGNDGCRNNWQKEFIPRLLNAYSRLLGQLRIDNLDAALMIVGGGRARICTYDCRFGLFFAVAPGGHIYPCNRFVGQTRWVLGSIDAMPTVEDLRASDAGKAFLAIRRVIAKHCSGCSCESMCNGGCTWQADLTAEKQDPECPAHFLLFTFLQQLSIEALLNEKNLKQALSDSKSRDMFDAPLLQIQSGMGHPMETFAKARRVLGAAALGVCHDPDEAISRLQRVGIVKRPEEAQQNIWRLYADLANPVSGFGNLYLHITDACNLHCSHCYTPANPKPVHVPVRVLCRLIDEAMDFGFAKVVLTGGEPTLHPDLPELLGHLVSPSIPRKTRLTFRSNLIASLDRNTVSALDGSIDELRVSLDGDMETHDKRRGPGSWKRAMQNLRNIIPKLNRCIVSLAVTTDGSSSGIAAAEAVQNQARELGIGFRVSPILPLGRFADANLAPDPHPFRKQGYLPRPASSCGIGAHVSITADGRAYPCHALTRNRFFLGNAFSGLSPILESDKMHDLRMHTVDTNLRCRRCAVRYLCGGVCRAWAPENEDLNTPVRDCRTAHARARNALFRALEVLEIPVNLWRKAGLPLPDRPPEVH